MKSNNVITSPSEMRRQIMTTAANIEANGRRPSALAVAFVSAAFR